MQKWDIAEKRKEAIMKHIQHLVNSWLDISRKETEPLQMYVRPLKVDRHLPIPKFTRALSRDKPFYMWYKLFKREMLRL